MERNFYAMPHVFNLWKSKNGNQLLVGLGQNFNIPTED